MLPRLRHLLGDVYSAAEGSEGPIDFTSPEWDKWYEEVDHLLVDNTVVVRTAQ